MIARHWRGLADTKYVDRYIEHLRSQTLPQLEAIPGFISASVMRRTLPEGTEFLVVTVWDSLDAIARFSGPDVETAVVPQNVQRWLIEYDRRARHYEVISA
jgi:heme-degrading monooxygenase HmoA